MPSARAQGRVTFRCPKCRKRLRASATALGQRGKCAACGAVFRIVRPAQAAPEWMASEVSPFVDAGPTGSPGAAAEAATLPIEVALRSGLLSTSILAAIAVLTALGLLGYVVFLR